MSHYVCFWSHAEKNLGRLVGNNLIFFIFYLNWCKMASRMHFYTSRVTFMGFFGCCCCFLSKLENWHSQRGPRWGACHSDLDLWPFDPKIYRRLPFFVLHLCMKYEVCRSNTVRVIVLQRSVDRRTDRQTDGQTDGQGDYYRAPASSMAGP